TQQDTLQGALESQLQPFGDRFIHSGGIYARKAILSSGPCIALYWAKILIERGFPRMTLISADYFYGASRGIIKDLPQSVQF
ncbi:MAG: hypothetical protein KDH97_24865, partial [Calditrichaeota bacterium]|nr:hypothetical protein [Calditrichota bacterium]